MKNLFLISLVFTQLVFTQKNELGNVTVDELKQEVHSIDSSASASVMMKRGKTSFNLDVEGKWQLNTEVEVKIKIFKKEGLEQANQQVPYFVGGTTDEKIFFSNAYTYNLVNGKVEKTKLKSEGEFKEKINENWSIKKITFPNVRVGSIIEYKYRLESPYITKIDDWKFQTSIPIDFVEYKVYIPSYFNYRGILTGFVNVLNEEKTLTSTSSFSENVKTFTVSNVPAIKEENYVHNIENYTSILKYELIEINYPNKFPQKFALNWEDVIKDIYSNENFGRELKFDNYFKEDLDPIIKKSEDSYKKMKNILAFVKQRVNWNERKSYYTDKGVKTAYKEHVGNSADINLMLVAMLKYAGLDANPVLLSTRDNGIASYPNRTAYNYVIAAVEMDSKTFLLDATNKNSYINILPLRDLNWMGRILRDYNSNNFVNLFPNTVSKHQSTYMVEIDETGNCSGKTREILYDYFAFGFREKYGNATNDVLKDAKEKIHEAIDIEEYTHSELLDFEKPIVENYSWSSDKLIDYIGDKMYFSPSLLFTMTENPFKQEKRLYPIEFNYPLKESHTISIKVPQNMVIESIPTNLNLVLDNGYGNYKFIISQNENQIQVVTSFEILSSIIPSEEYEYFKQFFSEIIKKQSEKIILKKK